MNRAPIDMKSLHNCVGNWTLGQNMDWKMGGRHWLMNYNGGEPYNWPHDRGEAPTGEHMVYL